MTLRTEGRAYRSRSTRSNKHTLVPSHRQIWEARPLPPERRLTGDRHSLHTLVTRICTLPPRLARHLISHYSKPNDLVLDPFCGKGTIPLEACLLGRTGLGTDISPEAVVVAKAAVTAPSIQEAQEYITDLSALVQDIECRFDIREVADSVTQFFDSFTLRQILAWRMLLRTDPSDLAAFTTGLLLGILHGKGESFLSLRCSHSYSMSPSYVREYVKKHGLEAPRRNVGQCLLRRAAWVLRDGNPPAKGRVQQADARALPIPTGLVNLALTSPPYFSVHRYARDNWLRLWFLGIEDYRDIQKQLIQTADVTKYTNEMEAALGELARVVAPQGWALILVGDVTLGKRTGSRTVQTARLIAEAATRVGFSCEGMYADHIPQKFKVAGYMANQNGITTERLVILRRECIAK